MRSQLLDIRMGLKNGASAQAIANALGFHPNLVQAMPNAVAAMAIDDKLLARDRIAAAKTFAVYISLKMKREERDRHDLVEQILNFLDEVLAGPRAHPG
jgi:hypothetical protein